MRLSYRGAQYESNQPSLEVTESEILGKYRGANWRCQTLQEVPVPQSVTTLKYRGVAYIPGQAAVTRPVDVASGRALQQRSVTIPEALPVLKEVARIHRSNLERNLERRLQIARRQGNQGLVSLLEAERKQLA